MLVPSPQGKSLPAEAATVRDLEMRPHSKHRKGVNAYSAEAE